MEKKLNTVYSNKYRIPLENEILKDHRVLYPQALHNELVFEITLTNIKLYEHVTHHKTLTVNGAKDTIINESINVPRLHEGNSQETMFNPDITDIKHI